MWAEEGERGCRGKVEVLGEARGGRGLNCRDSNCGRMFEVVEGGLKLKDYMYISRKRSQV